MILDDSNIAENYPGICSPLTCSLTEETYRLVFTRLAERFLGSAADVEDITGHMAVAHHGHMYYRLDNWLKMLRLLPFASRIVPLWRRSLGVPDSPLPPRPPVSRWRRYWMAWRLVRLWGATPRLMTGLEETFVGLTRDFEARFPYETQAASADCETGIAALRDLFARLKAGVLADWDITLLNDMRAFVYTDLARRTGAEVRGVALESLKPVAALAELRTIPGQQVLEMLTTNEEVTSFLSSGTPLGSAMRDYIDQYGDRGPGELKLESETFRTTPLAFAQLLGHGEGALQGGGSRVPPSQTACRDGNSERYVASRNKTSVRTRNPLARRALEAVAHRESSRLNRARLYGMIRAIAHRAGSLLARGGFLDNPEDVFYLTLDEMLGQPADHRPVVAQRRRVWAEYAAAEIPSRITLDDPGDGLRTSGTVCQKSIRTFGSSTSYTVPMAHGLRGTPAAAGFAEGDVLVVTEPGVDATGRIVVTTATDPGWVFLLSTAAGVITERGSPLSHTAIVCRELGVPAIVGVAGATQLLRTSDRVRMDATTGKIEVINHVSLRN